MDDLASAVLGQQRLHELRFGRVCFRRPVAQDVRANAPGVHLAERGQSNVVELPSRHLRDVRKRSRVEEHAVALDQAVRGGGAKSDALRRGHCPAPLEHLGSSLLHEYEVHEAVDGTSRYLHHPATRRWARLAALVHRAEVHQPRRRARVARHFHLPQPKLPVLIQSPRVHFRLSKPQTISAN